MRNQIYDRVVLALSDLTGSAPQDLVSGNGCRFTSSRRGKATVYHSNIAGGNRAEIAFHEDSFAERLRLQPFEIRPFFMEVADLTSRPTNPDPTYNWPRVGIASDDDVSSVMDHLSERYAT